MTRPVQRLYAFPPSRLLSYLTSASPLSLCSVFVCSGEGRLVEQRKEPTAYNGAATGRRIRSARREREGSAPLGLGARAPSLQPAHAEYAFVSLSYGLSVYRFQSDSPIAFETSPPLSQFILQFKTTPIRVLSE